RIWARAPRLPPIDAPWLVRAGLVATGLLTLGMALPLAALWPLWRFAAGVASALVFVYTWGWCLAQLAHREADALGGLIYTGPGAGIVVSGLAASAMVPWHWPAAAGWAVFGVLAFALTAWVWRTFSGGLAPAAAHAEGSAVTTAPRVGRAEIGVLAFAYGLAGLGYIVTATFLPVIARAAMPGSPWLDLFWPVFGAGVVIGALLATRLRAGGDRRALLAGCYVAQAFGIGLGIASPGLAGFALGSLLLGIPFTAITLFAMQEVRRLRPLAAASTMGLMTAMYGLGQIAGPPLVAALLKRSADAGAGFTLALEAAIGALLFGALLYEGLRRAHPLVRG
ncbi:MAG TPA: YbfB/YjiJ family MFS transporter, partial [Burkholderiaceae bacterium]|nr:YbfB/YjiJ family MFS transporter [Burkholderiaceae bacterium]